MANVDLFCPAVGTPAPPHHRAERVAALMRGMAIEVDGAIHDLELKMRKDEHKGRFLHDLGIGLTVIHASDHMLLRLYGDAVLQEPVVDSTAGGQYT